MHDKVVCDIVEHDQVVSCGRALKHFLSIFQLLTLYCLLCMCRFMICHSRAKSEEVDWEGKDFPFPGRKYYALEQVKKREQGKVGKIE